jgi:hypothetical protein
VTDASDDRESFRILAGSFVRLGRPLHLSSVLKVERYRAVGGNEMFPDLQTGFLRPLALGDPVVFPEDVTVGEFAYSDDVNSGFRSDVNKDRSAATLALA